MSARLGRGEMVVFFVLLFIALVFLTSLFFILVLGRGSVSDIVLLASLALFATPVGLIGAGAVVGVVILIAKALRAGPREAATATAAPPSGSRGKAPRPGQDLEAEVAFEIVGEE